MKSNKIKRTDKFTNLLRDLQERAKELNCIYRIEEVLNRASLSLDEQLHGVVNAIPQGWQFPEYCQAEIIYDGKEYKTDSYKEAKYEQVVNISVRDNVVGRLSVSYTKGVPLTGSDAFLKEEYKLLNTIADRIGHSVLHRMLKSSYEEWEGMRSRLEEKKSGDWRIIIDMLKKADRNLFIYISQKMIHNLCWIGVKKAKSLLEQIGNSRRYDGSDVVDEFNSPITKLSQAEIMKMHEEVFEIAAQSLSENKILSSIQKWITEDRTRFLVKAIDNPSSSLTEIIDAITRYSYLEAEGIELSDPIEKGLRVSLVRRFFFDQLEYINIAKKFIKIGDYRELVQKIIFPVQGRGKLGGKSAGQFLAKKILEHTEEKEPLLKNVKTPKTWYITSSGLITFLNYNNLEEIIEQKYKSLEEISLEYSNIIQIFKSSHFPPEMIKGMASAIDDFGENPIIVRSSSLLEDRLGAAFSGKYKSLYLSNQGTKEERLAALMDAVAEIYSSTFSPDPIEYRMERGLLDFHEEMGILIQEVVGKRVGKYYFPAFSGVAFSKNEFRWSSRIKREDGLLRLVPGLGTRAVDRVSDDYPVMVAPGNADLRVNITPEMVEHYSPRKMDVVNLETGNFETIEVKKVLKEFGNDYPCIDKIVSKVEDNHIEHPNSIFSIDFEKDNLVATFEGLFQRSPYLETMKTVLSVLESKIGSAVDIEFAHDGENIHLLQCRPQSRQSEYQSAEIPENIPESDIIFTADKFISNGHIPEITHIVYVDPAEYDKMSDIVTLREVGRCVGKLNKMLPKRKFILMGPGRWGSRGDIKLGVDVTYSDINNAAVLSEIAYTSGGYKPDLSFGTHFFQDLVEAEIRYIPLYPSDDGIKFDFNFFNDNAGILHELLPNYDFLRKIVKVIDVKKATGDKILRVLLNADICRAIAYLDSEKSDKEIGSKEADKVNEHWKWRYNIVEKLASSLDGEQYGVKGIYLFGSVKNATAGIQSDIDLIVHIVENNDKMKELENWFNGWSCAISELNKERAGVYVDNILDIHYITDTDIANNDSYASKINAVTDRAHPLEMKKYAK